MFSHRPIDPLTEQSLANDLLGSSSTKPTSDQAEFRRFVQSGRNALPGAAGHRRPGHGVPFHLYHTACDMPDERCRHEPRQRLPSRPNEHQNVLTAVADKVDVLDQEDRDDLQDAKPEHPLADVGNLIDTRRENLVLIEMELPEDRNRGEDDSRRRSVRLHRHDNRTTPSAFRQRRCDDTRTENRETPAAVLHTPANAVLISR